MPISQTGKLRISTEGTKKKGKDIRFKQNCCVTGLQCDAKEDSEGVSSVWGTSWLFIEQ